MTREQKFIEIQKRVNPDDLPEMESASIMVIINYLEVLREKKILGTPYMIPEKGKRVAAICEEYDWKPSDEEIVDFITSQIPDESLHEPFIYLLLEMRDNREEFLEEICGDMEDLS